MLDIPKNQKSLISLFFEDPRSRGPGIGTGYWILVTGYWYSGILVFWFLVPHYQLFLGASTAHLR